MKDLKFIEDGTSTDDTLQFNISEDGQEASIWIDSPYESNGETIGCYLSFSLTKDQARELAAGLLEWANAP